MKILGGGVGALRRHGGTIVVICGVKRRDFKKMGALLAAAGIFVPDMTRLKRCGLLGVRCPSEKDSVYPIGDGNNKYI
jgi:hypothetical protein